MSLSDLSMDSRMTFKVPSFSLLALSSLTFEAGPERVWCYTFQEWIFRRHLLITFFASEQRAASRLLARISIPEHARLLLPGILILRYSMRISQSKSKKKVPGTSVCVYIHHYLNYHSLRYQSIGAIMGQSVRGHDGDSNPFMFVYMCVSRRSKQVLNQDLNQVVVVVFLLPGTGYPENKLTLLLYVDGWMRSYAPFTKQKQESRIKKKKDAATHHPAEATKLQHQLLLRVIQRQKVVWYVRSI